MICLCGTTILITKKEEVKCLVGLKTEVIDERIFKKSSVAEKI